MSSALTFGVVILVGILTGFTQVVFIMIALSQPERPPSLWLRAMGAANVALGLFMIVYFATVMYDVRDWSDYVVPVFFGAGGVGYGAFGLLWRRRQGDVR